MVAILKSLPAGHNNVLDIIAINYYNI